LIAAVERDEALQFASGRERVLIEFCTQLLRNNHHVPEPTYQTAVTEFGIAELVQITVFLVTAS
jgi:hypothetical protein